MKDRKIVVEGYGEVDFYESFPFAYDSKKGPSVVFDIDDVQLAISLRELHVLISELELRTRNHGPWKTD